MTLTCFPVLVLHVCASRLNWFFVFFDWPNIVNCECCVLFVLTAADCVLLCILTG